MILYYQTLLKDSLIILLIFCRAFTSIKCDFLKLFLRFEQWKSWSKRIINWRGMSVRTKTNKLRIPLPPISFSNCIAFCHIACMKEQTAVSFCWNRYLSFSMYICLIRRWVFVYRTGHNQYEATLIGNNICTLRLEKDFWLL